MNSGPGFDIEAHDYDGLLKGSNSVESISNGAAPPVILQQQQQSGPAATGAQQPAPSPPSSASALAAQQQLQQHHHQQQQQYHQHQQQQQQAMPAATSPPTLAALPRGPTFMGSSGVSEVKLKRFLEHNQRLREHLEMRRIPVSEAT
ncbi:hypothetical protein BGZ89_006889 [Linnemannia elongata]|nr:hypothetical protein BGZ89_006889 [Linnemannia elongata]